MCISDLKFLKICMILFKSLQKSENSRGLVSSKNLICGHLLRDSKSWRENMETLFTIWICMVFLNQSEREEQLQLMQAKQQSLLRVKDRLLMLKEHYQLYDRLKCRIRQRSQNMLETPLKEKKILIVKMMNLTTI